MTTYYGGYDLGGIAIRAVIADKFGKFVCAAVKENVDKSNGPMGISNQMVRMMRDLAKKNDIPLKNIAGYGITAAGPLELTEPGILSKFGESIANSTNIVLPEISKPIYSEYIIGGIVYIPLGKPLKEELQCEHVKVINDVNGAVLGESWDGIGKGYDGKSNLTVATINIGAGLGGGVCQNGIVLEGHYGNAAEVGHFFSGLSSGVLCGCGNLDCAEAYASGTGIAHNGTSSILSTRSGFDSLIYEEVRKIALEKLPDAINDPEVFLKENPHVVLDYIHDGEERARVSRENDYTSGSFREAYNKALADLPDKIEDKEKFIDKHPCFPLQYVDSKIVCEQARKHDHIALKVIMDAQIALGNVLQLMAKAYNPRDITYYGSVIINNESLLKEPAARIMKMGLNLEAPRFEKSMIADNLGLHGGIRLAMQQRGK